MKKGPSDSAFGPTKSHGVTARRPQEENSWNQGNPLQTDGPNTLLTHSEEELSTLSRGSGHLWGTGSFPIDKDEWLALWTKYPTYTTGARALKTWSGMQWNGLLANEVLFLCCFL